MNRRRSTPASLADETLPESLRCLPDAPQQLFVRGRLPSGPYVAIVGSRNCTAYGRAVAVALSRGLASRGIVVVSGLARGIDAAAHRGALETGRTVAVLPGGLVPVYPPRHRALARNIARHGALLAEHPPGTSVAPWFFPRRNRLIAGLSLAVVVVEAALKSGARITAELALDYGREVLVVPGPITSTRSAGCHALLAQGAHPCTGVEDVLAQLPPSVRAALDAPDQAPRQRLHGAEAALVHWLEQYGPCSLETLLRSCDAPTPEAMAALTRLELQGRVERLADGRVQLLVLTAGSPPDWRTDAADDTS